MTFDPLSKNVANRFASSIGGSEDFIKLVESFLRIEDRAIHFKNKSTLGGLSYGDVVINFSNCPKEVAHGATFENNRIAVHVEGFGKDDPHAPPPTGKVKLEVSVNVLHRKGHPLRAKTGTPTQIAKYLADYLNKVVKEVEPVLP